MHITHSHTREWLISIEIKVKFMGSLISQLKCAYSFNINTFNCPNDWWNMRGFCSVMLCKDFRLLFFGLLGFWVGLGWSELLSKIKRRQAADRQKSSSYSNHCETIALPAWGNDLSNCGQIISHLKYKYQVQTATSCKLIGKWSGNYYKQPFQTHNAFSLTNESRIY